MVQPPPVTPLIDSADPYSKSSLQRKTRSQLNVLCGEMSISTKSKWRKDQVIDHILKTLLENPPLQPQLHEDTSVSKDVDFTREFLKSKTVIELKHICSDHRYRYYITIY